MVSAILLFIAHIGRFWEFKFIRRDFHLVNLRHSAGIAVKFLVSLQSDIGLVIKKVITSWQFSPTLCNRTSVFWHRNLDFSFEARLITGTFLTLSCLGGSHRRITSRYAHQVVSYIFEHLNSEHQVVIYIFEHFNPAIFIACLCKFNQ